MTFGSGPSDLVADIGDSKGDFVDFKLQWKAGSCPFARYHLTVSSPRSNDTQDGDTFGTNFIFADQEYWTEYTVTLKTSLCFVSDSLTAKIYTGPGSKSVSELMKMIRDIGQLFA